MLQLQGSEFVAPCLKPKGLLALAALQEGHNFRGEEIGLIEVGTEHTQSWAQSKKIIQQTWPDAMVSDASTS